MAKKTVEDLVIKKIDTLEVKVDYLTSKSIPELLVKIEGLTEKIKSEAKTEAAVEHRTTRIWGGIAGGLTLVISLVGVAIAYFK